MPFKSSKQRKFMHAKHPEIVKEWEKKYRYGGTIGGGESVAGTSSKGTENRHVFKEGGVADDNKKKKKEENGFFDYFKNPNVAKLEKMGLTKHGIPSKGFEKAEHERKREERKKKKGYEHGEVVKKDSYKKIKAMFKSKK